MAGPANATSMYTQPCALNIYLMRAANATAHLVSMHKEPWLCESAELGRGELMDVHRSRLPRVPALVWRYRT